MHEKKLIFYVLIARKRHEAFERKRAQHYNEADVFHKNLDLDEEEEDDNDVEK